ncbi:MAG: 2-oxoglutarate ferredoxin oxidoreductase subunit gamma [Desulfarculus sp.]|jgi:2-oxoglutarate ferredoxin oxidoreductase subunit gamma|nr:MAG: 2-oxoglutarate ferredoxin oxidoreductase subunit gamma [Desulfarculus sp.]
MKDRLEIVASGFGGQGVVRLGQVLGEAAVKEGLRVTMLKSHGTEMRGGYVRSQVVLSPKTIDSPMCENPDFFVALSSAAYNRFKDTVPQEGLILFDPAFVEEIDAKLPCAQRELPAKQLALDNFGRVIFSNSIALGAMARLLEGQLKKEGILESLLEIIPKFHQENRDAFEIGYNYMN